MIRLRTVLTPADNSGAKKLKVIHIYKGFKHDTGTVGDIVAAVVDQVDTNGVVKDGEIVKAVIVRTKKEIRRKDGTYLRFDDNAGVVIDKDGNPRGTRIFGPIAKEVRDAGFAKIVSLVKEVY